MPREPPICCVVFTSALATPRVPIANTYEGGAAEGRERQAEAHTHQDFLWGDMDPEITMHADLRKPGQRSGRCDEEAYRHGYARPDPWDGAYRCTGGKNDPESEGKEGEPSFER